MVKQPSKRPAVNLDGTPRKKPGRVARPTDTKVDRLVLRVHPDLMRILTDRARERGITRSQYVEKLLIGWANLDPRNQRLDMIGKINPAAPLPNDVRLRSPLSFADRWVKFGSASRLLLGAEPPKEWLEESIGSHADPDYDTNIEANDTPTPPSENSKKK